MREYRGIANELAERIEGAGGEAELPVIATKLAQEFDVKQGAVRPHRAGADVRRRERPREVAP